MTKKTLLAVLGAIGLATAMLCGCQNKDEKQNSVSDNVSDNTPDGVTNPAEASPAFQFVKGYGIVKSEHTVYVADGGAAPIQTQGDVTLSLVDVVLQDRTLIANFLVSEYSKRPPAGGSDMSFERYREDIWTAGEGIRLTGPDITEEAGKPVESQYIAHPDFYEEYGYMRSFIVASFNLSFAPDAQELGSGYALQVLDFKKPVKFSLKQAPEYESLEALAAGEGTMDTHDGLSVLAVGKAVEEGILVDWYRCYESNSVTASLSHTPPMQKGSVPLLFSGEKEYPSQRSLLYMDKMNLYSLEGVVGGHSFKQLFLVPKEEQSAVFSLKVPGITYLSAEESKPVTISIPENYEALTEEIPFLEGAVRLHKITKLTEEPAVYLDVSAVDDGRAQDLKSLICQKKAGKNPGDGKWKNQRYDFNDKGNLSGFRIFCDEGDTEITLKFSRPGFYRAIVYTMELDWS